ncbi:MAG: hypothetical protein ACFFAS_20365 [Promethearchaeota archaeon]
MFNKTCDCYRENSSTCQAGGGDYCGMYRKLSAKSRKLKRRGLTASV